MNNLHIKQIRYFISEDADLCYRDGVKDSWSYFVKAAVLQIMGVDGDVASNIRVN